MIAYTPAKINIGLRILNKRADGFHNLDSYFYRVPLYDIIEIKTHDQDELVQTGVLTSTSMEENLVHKALNLLRKNFEIPPLKIHLHKQIPVQAGLGGGSGNASGMLKLLNNYFQLNISKREMLRYAGELGSDCPFFIEGKAAHVTGRGEIIEPIDFSLAGTYIAIIKAPVAMETARAFQLVNKSNKKLEDIQSIRKEEYQYFMLNDFESSFHQELPEVTIIKNLLMDSGAFYASLSGSGSAVFALFESKPHLQFDSSYFSWIGLLQ
ncbi:MULTISPECIES: 4-(cytidine 5'-diphospho)-2-C-methyl-D-erythritol kinase [unclassified Lentimicrobium]|uniref:4-(cytidine 5'-diphospho)-2-C-methyl-D-erythritol kinase n=1 Tax=unclassified Lentimicrobium TaxID=2677434 RepID=UPI0015538641|nr:MULTISPECIES: 4-(cytidine 5'-diphospho)-2-C-methyl-D-erythritol kinase [unclassified Lentimicrobium]NPD47651.1 4-(cytidine 5'-diphospho)-2-C-methyl-D-erythritol kinase [Lentimicrobium sp. S6]NPD86994.1 4-(cytidine 5'-diphospho)-2-C-methyl-D-erythritol kinase [Lentimicrobium sp. L6]